MSVATHLTKAVEAVKTDREKAAGHVAAAWREQPAPELLELACALSPPPSLLGKNGKATIELLTAAGRGKPDPRTSRALETLFRDLPFTADSSKPVWRAACDLAGKLGDPRFVLLAKELPPTWRAREAIVAWLGSQLTKAVADLTDTPVPTLDAAAKKLVASITASTPAPTKKSGGEDVEALFATVYARPDDDDARRVLADALLERGDERGELITLQLLPSLTPKDEKRVKQLLKANDEAWLGGLERYLTKQRTFTRGFVSEAKVIFRTIRDAETAAPLPAWATIEVLTFGEGTSSGSHEWGQTLPASLPALRVLNGLRTRGVQNLLDAKTPWTKLEAIEGWAGDFQVWEQLTKSDRFPALRAVALSGLDPAWVRRAPPPAHWTHLTLHGGDTPTTMLGIAHGLKTRDITIRTREARWSFTRDAKGGLTQLRVDVTFPNRDAMAALELKHLPKGSLTRFDAELPEVKAVGASLLGEGDVALPAAEPRKLGRPFAIGFSGKDVLWADKQGVVDASMNERISSRWAAAAFSGDGRSVVALAGPHLEVFDLASGARTATHKTAWASNLSLSVSFDGKTIAAARPAETLVHREGDAKPRSHKGSMKAAISPDGTRLARVVSKGTESWVELDVVGVKGKATRIETGSSYVEALAFSPDGSHLAIAARGAKLLICSLADGATKHLPSLDTVAKLVWSPDGRRLAVASFNESAVIDLATGKTKKAPAAITAAWASDGRLRFGTDAPHQLLEG